MSERVIRLYPPMRTTRSHTLFEGEPEPAEYRALVEARHTGSTITFDGIEFVVDGYEVMVHPWGQQATFTLIHR